MSLRDFLKDCEAKGEVVNVSGKVSSRLEAASLLAKYDGGPVVMLQDVEGKGLTVVGGICGIRERIYRALGVREASYFRVVSEALRNPIEPVVVDDAPVNEVDLGSSLEKLPVLTYYEKDPGPYITAGMVVAKDIDEGFQNASVHRLLVLDRERMAIRMVPRHLYALYKKAVEREVDLQVAIVVGIHPAVLFAACCNPPLGVDELWVANRLLGGRLRLTRCNKVDLLVPADAELLIEGVIKPGETALEGPFLDVTGTYDEARQQPIIRVLRVSMRRGALYHAILPGGCEHRLLMGMPREVSIWEAVSNVVPEVKAVRLTPGGCNWLHAVVAIRKQWEGDGKNAALAAFTGHPSLKHVVIVDWDVNVDDPIEVERAIALNVQGDEDLIMIKGARGSSLDPSSSKQGITCKVGVDATKKLRSTKS
ncbi:MAG: UbiD family decarboxylase [Thermoprotei archaeon]|nr:MAG: UbiD family decarboxylase [Thermoprotei archaeon]